MYFKWGHTKLDHILYFGDDTILFCVLHFQNIFQLYTFSILLFRRMKPCGPVSMGAKVEESSTERRNNTARSFTGILVNKRGSWSAQAPKSHPQDGPSGANNNHTIACLLTPSSPYRVFFKDWCLPCELTTEDGKEQELSTGPVLLQWTITPQTCWTQDRFSLPPLLSKLTSLCVICCLGCPLV